MAKKSKILDALKRVYESRIKELQDEIKAYGNTISQTIADLEEENKRLNMVNGAGRATIGDLGTEVNHLRESLSMAEALNKDYKNTIKELSKKLDFYENPKSILDSTEPDEVVSEKDFEAPNFILTVASANSDSCNNWLPIMASVLKRLLTEESFKATTDHEVAVIMSDVVELRNSKIEIVIR